MSADVLHCEVCSCEWPIDLPGLDDHEEACRLRRTVTCHCGAVFERPPGTRTVHCSPKCRRAARARDTKRWRDRQRGAINPEPNGPSWPFLVPARTDAPWCRYCGMTLPAHWPRVGGLPCPEKPA